MSKNNGMFLKKIMIIDKCFYIWQCDGIGDTEELLNYNYRYFTI